MRVGMVVALIVAAGTVASAAPKKHAPGALVLVIDRSGSMQGPKLDAVKEGVLAAVDALAPDDQVAVVTFDSEATVAVKLQRAANKKQIAKDVAEVRSGGGTDILPALESAYALVKDSKLAWKHVIVMTDGEAPDQGLAALVKTMHDAHVTISTIGVAGADRSLLTRIAEGGEGRLFMVDDLAALPKVFVSDLKSAQP